MTWRLAVGERRSLAVVTLAVLVGGLVCAVELGTRSLWLDEGATVAITSQHGHALWRAIAHDGGNMLVYYLVLHGVVGAFGDAAAVIRLPSVLASALTALATASLALRLFADRRVALAAALLTTLSLPLVFWGQDARGYAPMVTFGTLSFLALLGVLDASPDGPIPWRAAVLYGLATLIALYVGFDAVLLVPAQLALLLGARQRARLVIGTLVVVAVLCLPLGVLAADRGSSQLFWVPGLSGPVLGETLVTLLSAGMPPNFHASWAELPIVALTLAVLLAGAARAVRRGVPFPARFLIAWIVVPSVIGLLAAAAGEPIELSRTAILLIPPVALALARMTVGACIPRLAGLAVLAVLLALRLVVLVPSYGTSPENWKAATRAVLAASGQDACVAFYPEDGRMPFDYYVRAAAPTLRARLTPVLPATPFSRIRPFVEDYRVPSAARIRQIVAACPRLWLIASHQGTASGPAASRRHLREYDAVLGALALRYTGERSDGFGYAAVVHATLFTRTGGNRSP